MKMPKVEECAISDCAYNQGNKCHALAVTIGHGVHPQCDTFCKSEQRGGDAKTIAGVGACKVDVCAHNKAFECNATSVRVGWNGSEIDCLTFSQRR